MLLLPMQDTMWFWRYKQQFLQLLKNHPRSLWWRVSLLLTLWWPCATSLLLWSATGPSETLLMITFSSRWRNHGGWLQWLTWWLQFMSSAATRCACSCSSIFCKTITTTTTVLYSFILWIKEIWTNIWRDIRLIFLWSLIPFTENAEDHLLQIIKLIDTRHNIMKYHINWSYFVCWYCYRSLPCQFLTW